MPPSLLARLWLAQLPLAREEERTILATSALLEAKGWAIAATAAAANGDSKGAPRCSLPSRHRLLARPQMRRRRRRSSSFVDGAVDGASSTPKEVQPGRGGRLSAVVIRWWRVLLLQ